MRDPVIKLDVCVMLFFFTPFSSQLLIPHAFLTLSFPEGYDVPISMSDRQPEVVSVVAY